MTQILTTLVLSLVLESASELGSDNLIFWNSSKSFAYENFRISKFVSFVCAIYFLGSDAETGLFFLHQTYNHAIDKETSQIETGRTLRPFFYYGYAIFCCSKPFGDHKFVKRFSLTADQIRYRGNKHAKAPVFGQYGGYRCEGKPDPSCVRAADSIPFSLRAAEQGHSARA